MEEEREKLGWSEEPCVCPFCRESLAQAQYSVTKQSLILFHLIDKHSRTVDHLRRVCGYSVQKIIDGDIPTHLPEQVCTTIEDSPKETNPCKPPRIPLGASGDCPTTSTALVPYSSTPMHKVPIFPDLGLSPVAQTETDIQLDSSPDIQFQGHFNKREVEIGHESSVSAGESQHNRKTESKERACVSEIIESHECDGTYKCGICGKYSTSSVEQLIQHTCQKHVQENRLLREFYCPWCVEEGVLPDENAFTKFRQLTDHMLRHQHKRRLPRDITCVECLEIVVSEKFFDNSEYKQVLNAYYEHIWKHARDQLGTVMKREIGTEINDLKHVRLTIERLADKPPYKPRHRRMNDSSYFAIKRRRY